TFEVLRARFGPLGDLEPALQRLSREHLLVEQEGGVWTGLHQVRSSEIIRILHAAPPPTLMDTIARVLEDAPSDAAARRLPAAIQLTFAGLHPLSQLVAERVRAC